MKYDAKVFTPKYVDNEIDLKCAINTREVVIVSSDKALFVELEAKFKKKKASTKTKKRVRFFQRLEWAYLLLAYLYQDLMAWSLWENWRLRVSAD